MANGFSRASSIRQLNHVQLRTARLFKSFAVFPSVRSVRCRQDVYMIRSIHNNNGDFEAEGRRPHRTSYQLSIQAHFPVRTTQLPKQFCCQTFSVFRARACRQEQTAAVIVL